MNKKFILIYSAIFLIFVMCSTPDEIDTSKSVIRIDSVKVSQFDKYLDEIYTKPYNIRLLYKWESIESDLNFAVVPTHTYQSIRMANLIKYLCLDAYEAVAPKGFLRRFFPKTIVLIGSAAYRGNATKVLGTAEGGVKITLYDINNLKTSDIEELYEFYFRTIFHEFSHILHQTKDYTVDFDRITSTKYKSGSWSSAWGDKKEEAYVRALNAGFISTYSSKEPNEDFVELIAHYITNSESVWDARLENANDGGKLINQKMQIVKFYLKEVWKIDIDKLRAEVLKRANNLENQNLDDITIGKK